MVDNLCKVLCTGAERRYGLLEKEWMGYSLGQCRYSYTMRLGADASYFMGVQPNADKLSEFWTTVRLDFNPAKIANYIEFDELYNALLAKCKYMDFKRFDVAVDRELYKIKILYN